MSGASVLTYTSPAAGSRIAGRFKRGLAAYKSLPEPPPAGFQYATSDGTLPSGEPPNQSLGDNSSPPMAAGDCYAPVIFTNPDGYRIPVINADGSIVINNGGDTSRELILYGVWRKASLAFDPPNFPASAYQLWDHEQAAVWNGGIFIPLSANWVVGIPIVPVPLVPLYVSSPEGDPLIIALYSGSLPPGLSIDSVDYPVPTLVGTPTVPLVPFTFQLSATDITGTASISPPSQITIAPLPGASDNIRVRRHARRLRDSKPPTFRDWQSQTLEEVEKTRRIGRKLREAREGRNEAEGQPATREPELSPAVSAPPAPPGPPPPLLSMALGTSKARAADDQAVMDHLRAEHASLAKLIDLAMRQL